MKYKFFLSYVPLMIAVSVFAIWLAGRFDDKAYLVSYSNEKTEQGIYLGSEIHEEDMRSESADGSKKGYNGTNLIDNGMPYAIKVNKKQNVVTVYKVGKSGCYDIPVKAMVCSVGESGNTPEGIFALGERSAWLALQGDVYGQYGTKITGNILFHSVPYFSQSKSDLEVEEYNKLGESVSAGCVRLTAIDSKWIYDYCDQKTLVEIFSSDYEGPMGKPIAPKINEDSKYNNWDPTDPDTANPYMEDAPVILGAYDREIDTDDDYDISAGVSAIDKNGDNITGLLKITGEVDTDKCGVYPITYSVTDKDNKQNSVTINVIVKDNNSPVLTVDQKITSIGVDDASNDDHLLSLLRQNVKAYDGAEEMPPESILVDYSDLKDKDYGKCHVKYVATDDKGNKSDVIVLDVEVDMHAPVISLNEKFQRELKTNNALDDKFLLSMVDATDNSGDVELSLSRPLTYKKDEPYKVMYYAKDPSGNISSLSVTFQLK